MSYRIEIDQEADGRVLAEVPALPGVIAYGATAEDAYFVVCDERINSHSDVRTGTVNILVGFAALRPGEYHAYLITHEAAGWLERQLTETMAIAANRYHARL